MNCSSKPTCSVNRKISVNSKIFTKCRRIIKPSTALEFKLDPDVCSPKVQPDHIRTNIEMVKVQPELQKTYNLLKTHIKISELIKTKVDKQLVCKRKLLINKMSKWDNFRERRQKAIDEYIRQVRIKKARHTMIKQIALQKTLKDISEWLKTAKRNRLIKIKGQMMVAWISLQWKKKMKRRGASLEIILRNKFRYVLTGQPLEM